MLAGVGAFMSADLPRRTESKIRPKRAQNLKVIAAAERELVFRSEGKPFQVSTENAAKPDNVPSVIHDADRMSAGTATNGARNEPRTATAHADVYHAAAAPALASASPIVTRERLGPFGPSLFDDGGVGTEPLSDILGADRAAAGVRAEGTGESPMEAAAVTAVGVPL